MLTHCSECALHIFTRWHIAANGCSTSLHFDTLQWMCNPYLYILTHCGQCVFHNFTCWTITANLCSKSLHVQSLQWMCVPHCIFTCWHIAGRNSRVVSSMRRNHGTRDIKKHSRHSFLSERQSNYQYDETNITEKPHFQTWEHQKPPSQWCWVCQLPHHWLDHWHYVESFQGNSFTVKTQDLMNTQYLRWDLCPQICMRLMNQKMQWKMQKDSKDCGKQNKKNVGWKMQRVIPSQNPSSRPYPGLPGSLEEQDSSFPYY